MGEPVTGRMVYLHGLPGSAAELNAALGGQEPPGHVTVLERLERTGLAYRENLLAAFDGSVARRPVTLVAFSLGAMSALVLAAERSSLVERVVLVSPAAPLGLGDFLPGMAGRLVFRAAQLGQWPLEALSVLQRLAMRIAPDTVVMGMFGGTSPRERQLALRPDFRRALVASLEQCLGSRRGQYRRELLAYVSDWSECLARVSCDVAIWHGDADTWAPLAMSEALRTRIAGRVTLNICPGLGHFTTLHQAARFVLGKA